MVSIQVTQASFNEFVVASSLKVDWSKLVFIGIRGGVPHQPNQFMTPSEAVIIDQTNLDFNQYHCSLIQVRDKKVSAFTATTVPGVYWVENPTSSKGAARLLEGKHKFIRGKHKGNSAFVQGQLFPVLRDRDQDESWEDDNSLDYGDFGIHLHAGGSSTIGKWSAGCQVIKAVNGVSWNSDSWLKFKNTAYGVQQNSYEFILIDFNWLRPPNKMRLMWGSEGSQVVSLQNQLIKKQLYHGAVDGKFSISTLQAVTKFKVSNGLGSYGVVGDQTWQALMK